MILRLVLASLLLLLDDSSTAAESKRPVGQNCDLATPPKSAGEDTNHGLLLFVFPRARDIGVNYTGCQLIWTQSKTEVTLGWLVWIQSGKAVRVWSTDAEMNAMLGQCFWEKGILKNGRAETCGNSEDTVMKSYLPGCISKGPRQPLSNSEFDAYWEKHCGEAE